MPESGDIHAFLADLQGVLDALGQADTGASGNAAGEKAITDLQAVIASAEETLLQPQPALPAGFDRLDADFITRLQALIAAASVDGITLTVSSGFREVAHQEELFLENYQEDPAGSVTWNGKNWSQLPGAVLVAPPGESLHNHGFAVDFHNASPGTETAQWLIDNVEDFGLRHGASFGEPWHIAPTETESVADIPDGGLVASSGDPDVVTDHQVGDHIEDGVVYDDTTGESVPVDAVGEADAVGEVPPFHSQGGTLTVHGTSPPGGDDSQITGMLPSTNWSWGTGSQEYATALQIPSGFRTYKVGDRHFLVYRVSDPTGRFDAEAFVYFEISGTESDWVNALGPPIPNTPAQWAESAGEWVNGGDASVLKTETDFIGRTWDDIVTWATDALDMLGTDALADSGVMFGIASLIADTDMDPAAVEDLFVGTDWWEAHTAAENAWNDASMADRNQLVIDSALSLLQTMEYYTGTPMDSANLLDVDGNLSWDVLKERDPDLAEKAEALASGKTTMVQLVTTWIKPAAAGIPNSPHNRRLEEELQQQGAGFAAVAEKRGQVIGLYEAYGIAPTEGVVNNTAQQLWMNETSLVDLEDTIKDASVQRWPTKPRELDWATWAEPYRTSYKTLLETGTPSFKDDLLKQHLGGQEIPSVYDFERLLRKDPRWQQTKNAKDSYYSTYGQIGRLMGFG